MQVLGRSLGSYEGILTLPVFRGRHSGVPAVFVVLGVESSALHMLDEIYPQHC